MDPPSPAVSGARLSFPIGLGGCSFPVSFTSVAAIKCLSDAAEGRQWYLLSYSSRLQPITVGKSGWELQTAGYVTLIDKSREK